MALTQGSKILYSDFKATKDAVDAAYTKTKGSAPTWTNAPTAAGSLATYASLSSLNTFGTQANAALVTVKYSTHYSSHGTGGSTGDFVQYNSNKSTWFTGNNKCGGTIVWLGQLFQQQQKEL